MHDKVLVEIAKWTNLQRVKAIERKAPPPRRLSFLRLGDKVPNSTRTDNTPPSNLY